MPDAARRFPALRVDQKAWFASDDNQFLGIVLYDKFDENPWCFFIARKSPKSGKYKNVFNELDVTDLDDSIEKLKVAMEALIANAAKKGKET